MTLRSLVLSFLATGAALYVAVLAAMYLNQRNLLYHPDRASPPLPAGMDEVWLTAEDGVRLNAWYAPPKDNRGVVLFLHGNAGNLALPAAKLQDYLQAGHGVLAIDWRGYGKSQGLPSEEGLFADGRAALAFLKEKGVGFERVVLHGESLGSGVAVLLASENRFAGIVLEAPFLSVAEAAQSHYPYLPARWLVKDRFDNLSRIAQVQAPILILHCESDRTVPVAHGRALLAAAGPKARGLFFPGGGHMESFDQGGRAATLDFIREVLGRP